MSSFNLTVDHPPIQGRFWHPEFPDEVFTGMLYLEAGRRSRLETSDFNDRWWRNLFPGVPNLPIGQRIELKGDELTRAMHAPPRKMIHGHDEQGQQITLLNCSPAGSRMTSVMSRHTYDCEAAIFGRTFADSNQKIAQLSLALDRLDPWLNRIAFGRRPEYEIDDDGRKRIARFVIEIAKFCRIPMGIAYYKDSSFLCNWGYSVEPSELKFESMISLELTFMEPIAWEDLMGEIHRWQWFLSLATRTPVDVTQMGIGLDGDDLNDSQVPQCPVWVARSESSNEFGKREARDFHFGFSDVESTFAEVFQSWLGIQSRWSAVLHRFFAISNRRGLWLNEEFLFLAQAIESLFRARAGATGGKLDFGLAAKDAYLKAPADLRDLLGERRVFVNRLRKSRNYWTHYGDPAPGADPDVLDGDELHDFNVHLRWVVEAAILEEIGVPPHCVARVWDRRWRPSLVKYE